jgi:hypothetical protein
MQNHSIFESASPGASFIAAREAALILRLIVFYLRVWKEVSIHWP